MSRTVSLLQRVQIASPCTASWDEMRGDHQVRFCSHCNLNVYNLSAMTQEEGERLIREKEGRLCARIYRRHDGTVLTQDCPVGLRAVRRRAIAFGVKVAAAVLVICGTTVSLVAGQRSRERYLSSDPRFAPNAFECAAHTLQTWLGHDPTRGIIMGAMLEVPDPITSDPGSP